MWLDVYQTPVVVTKSRTEELKGFAGEVRAPQRSVCSGLLNTPARGPVAHHGLECAGLSRNLELRPGASNTHRMMSTRRDFEWSVAWPAHM